MAIEARTDAELVQPEILSHFSDLVRDLGSKPDPLLSLIGIDPDAFAKGYVHATYRQYIDLLELAAQTLGCLDFGMRLAVRQQGVSIYGPLGPAMRYASRFSEALDYAVTHVYAHSLAARIWIRRLSAEDAILCCHDILLDGIANQTQAIEQMLLVGKLGARELTGGRAHASRVHFRHQPVSSIRTYRRHFACDVRFGQDENGLLFSKVDFASPIVDSNPIAFGQAAAYIENSFSARTPSLSAQVRGLVLQHLGTARCTNAQVASELSLHIRTLRRRLSMEGTSFQAIKNGVRHDRLLYYLRHTDLELSCICERLGFAEQAIMTRWCRKLHACTPTWLRVNGFIDQAKRNNAFVLAGNQFVGR